MKKSIHEVIEKEALDILKETYHEYENSSVFKSVSFEEVLEAQANYLEAKKIDMKSKNLIKKIKDETQLNNKQIAEIVGKSPPTISRYLNGEEIPTEVIHILTDKFGIEKPQEYSCELNNVEIYEVSKRTGISEHFIRLGLQQGVLPFGYAIRGDGKAYQYWIFRGAFERFMEQNK